MKKILSALLSVAMLLSLVVVATLPTAAAASDWTVWTEATAYEPGVLDEEKKSVAGYDYESGIFEGFHASNFGENIWQYNTPYAHLQTTNAVNLKDGVYMEVVVEEFDYQAGDAWFNVNIWSQSKIISANPDEKYGYGVQTLLRPNTSGIVSGIQWEIEQWTGAGNSTIAEENKLQETVGENKYTKIVLEITYDATNGYHVTINGSSVAAPAEGGANKVDAYLNEAFANGEAYIGFAMHNTSNGSNLAATVTKFGTSAEDATVPTGDAEAEPINYEEGIEVADPMPADEVPAGKPGILMTGNRAESDLWAIPNSGTGSRIEIDPDTYNVKVTAKGGTSDAGSWKVDLDKNYDLKDFPTYMVITKNLCTCGMGDKADCLAFESAAIYILVGELRAAGTKQKVALEVCTDSVIINGENYLYFYVDLINDYGSTIIDNEGTTIADGGRINGVRFDVNGFDATDLASLKFEVCEMGFFRNLEDAEAHFDSFINTLQGGTIEPPIDETETVEETDPVEETVVETDAPETQAPETDAPETEAPETEAPETEAPDTDAPEQTTKAPEQTTEAPKTEQTTEAPKTEEPKSGCGSVVGFGAVAVVVAMAAGIVCFKKKED